MDSARQRFGCTSRTDSSSEETSRRASATSPEDSAVTRGAMSSCTPCAGPQARGGCHDGALTPLGAAGREAVMSLLPAAPVGAMHLVMIAASILSRSSLHAVRSGGAIHARPSSPGCAQVLRRARERHGRASAVVSQPFIRGSRISHSWRYDTRKSGRERAFTWATEAQATSPGGRTKTGAYQSRSSLMLPFAHESGISTAVIGTAGVHSQTGSEVAKIPPNSVNSHPAKCACFAATSNRTLRHDRPSMLLLQRPVIPRDTATVQPRIDTLRGAYPRRGIGLQCWCGCRTAYAPRGRAESETEAECPLAREKNSLHAYALRLPSPLGVG
eukprot:6209479-Pleurochrysis_carterae.AAC.1